MKALYQAVANRLTNGESSVLATVFDASGSAPRSSGAKMAVFRDGSIIGTIGGGRLENDAIRLAATVFEDKKDMIYAFNLAGEDVAGSDMVCGGQGRIVLNFIDAANADNSRLFQDIITVLFSRGRAWLITGLGDVTDEADGRLWLVRQDGTITGNTQKQPDLSWLFTVRHSQMAIHADMSGDLLLVEPIRQGGLVYLFGAGHVSRQIAPLCETVGFQVVVLDDRSEFANKERFPMAEIVLLSSFEQLHLNSVDEQSYLVIVTRGHLHDKTVLEQALRTNAAYIGMIGSRRKRDMLYASLLANGFTQQDIERVYSPIGLDIDAETPEEIAISVVGELIKVRARRWRNGETV